MKIAFKNSFSEQSNNFDNLPNLKKLKGYTNYYRIRTGNYRIGLK